jgi:D-apionolactonase
LSIPGVAGLTYFETAGERGVHGGKNPALAGLSPAGRVLRFLAAAAGRPVLDCEMPTDLAALPLATSEGELELLLGNLSGQDRSVIVRSHSQIRNVPLAGWAVVHLRPMTKPRSTDDLR